MGHVFKSINEVTRTEEQMNTYNKPMWDSVSHVAIERVNEVSQGKYTKPKTPSKTYNGPHFRPHNNSHLTPLSLPIAVSLAGIMEGHSSVMVRTVWNATIVKTNTVSETATS